MMLVLCHSAAASIFYTGTTTLEEFVLAGACIKLAAAKRFLSF